MNIQKNTCIHQKHVIKLIYINNNLKGGVKKVRLEIKFDANTMPVHYRMGILSVIKEALTKSDQSYYEKIFTPRNNIKPFGYSVYLHDFSFQSDQIILNGFRIIISSSNHEFMFHFYNGLQQIEQFNYKGHHWIRRQIKIIQEELIQSERVLFKTLSPILIEGKDGKPVNPSDRNYEVEFNYYANLVVEKILGRRMRRQILVKPIHMKKNVIKESNQTFRNSAKSREHLFFTAYKGYLLLEGDPEDLTCLYQNAVSRRRSLGFGLLDVELEGVR